MTAIEVYCLLGIIVLGILYWRSTAKLRILTIRIAERDRIDSLIFDTSLTGFWDWDLSKNVGYISPGLKLLLGYEDSELPNEAGSWQRIIHPDDWQKLNASFARHSKSKGVFVHENEIRCFHKNGSTRWMHAKGSVIEWDEEKPKRVIGTYIDITQVIETRQSLNYSEQFLREFILNVEDYAIIRLDPSGVIQQWNKGAARLSGYEPKEIVGQNFSIFFGKEDRSTGKPAWLLQEALRKKKFEDEGWRIKRDGSRFWVSSIITALFDQHGHHTGYAKVIRDLTDKRLSLERLAASEMRTRRILDSMPDAVVIINSEGTIVFANDEVSNLLKYKPGELIGRKVESLVPKRFGPIHEGYRKNYSDAPISRRMGKGLEQFAVDASGVEIPVDISLSPIYSEPNKPEIIASIRDVRDRYSRAQQEQRHIRNMELSQELGTMGYYEQDFKTHTVRISQNFMKLFGHSENVVREDYLWQMVHEEDRENLKINFTEAIDEHARNFQAEFRIVHPESNETIYVRNSSYFIYNENAELESAVGLQQDITSFRLSEMRIKKLVEELRVNNQELEAFSYSVSHDLRAPVRAIAGFSTKLSEYAASKFDSEAHRLLNVIKTNAERMHQLIDDVLAFSRISRQHILMNAVDLTSVFDTAWREVSHLQGSLNVQIHISNLPRVKGDQAMLKVVALNLLGNAVKYSKGVEHPAIEVKAVVNDGVATISVSDNGVGFDMRYHDKLFEVFHRLHPDNQFEGTGVGLAIVHRVVTKHGGKIWAESKPGFGATFFFTMTTI